MVKYGFVYVWRDSKRNMYYVGCHWGNVDDGYVCSSTRMRNAYRRRPEDFKRRVVELVHTSRRDLLEAEHRWIDMIKESELSTRYYNATKKHFGHWSMNPASYKNMVERNVGERNPMYGRKHRESTKELMSAAKRGKKPNNYGKQLSEETRKRMSEGQKKRYQKENT